MQERFNTLAKKTTSWAGSPLAFGLALFSIVLWVIAGFFVGFGGTLYQLVINTGTTIITFLMVFLIQNTQNRDSHAMHLKLDELIRANEKARNRFIVLDDLTESELGSVQTEMVKAARDG